MAVLSAPELVTIRRRFIHVALMQPNPRETPPPPPTVKSNFPSLWSSTLSTSLSRFMLRSSFLLRIIECFTAGWPLRVTRWCSVFCRTPLKAWPSSSPSWQISSLCVEVGASSGVEQRAKNQHPPLSCQSNAPDAQSGNRGQSTGSQ